MYLITYLVPMLASIFIFEDVNSLLLTLLSFLSNSQYER